MQHSMRGQRALQRQSKELRAGKIGVHSVIVVPAFPANASIAFSIEVITVFFPPFLTNSIADSIFGPMLPSWKCPWDNHFSACGTLIAVIARCPGFPYSLSL